MPAGLYFCKHSLITSLLEENIMAFFNSAVGVLQTLVIALGAGLGIWGVVNLMEGYGNDNRATRSQFNA
jgi:hypothetical protein